MSTAKHTPGPWEADSNGKIWGDIDNEKLDGDSPLLAEMFGNGQEQRANARLIAAAPELLEACIRLLPAAEDGIAECGKDSDTDKNILFARATIAKATRSGSEAA